MRAYVLNRYGGPEAASLQALPGPEPGTGQVRIRVHAAGLNPVDYKTRAGVLKPIYRYPLPVVMGSELAGVVDAIGAQVSDIAVGDRVFTRVAKEDLGAFADFACVDAALVAPMPSNLSFEQAAAVPLAALTALQCLRDELDAGRGMRLLITGGAGGVGCFAIPLAKWLGASVTTTASARGDALVRRLGANEVIDYTSASPREQAGSFDAALDLVGGSALRDCFVAVRRGGRVVSIAAVPEPRTALIDLDRNWLLAALFLLISLPTLLLAAWHGVRYRYKFMHPSSADLRMLAGLIEDGTLQVQIDRVFEFEQIAEAMAFLEAGHAKGKVVVRMLP
jgi:alcohol dehydrogenase